jgi:hypothetical protein
MSDSVNTHQGMATAVQKTALGVAIVFLVVGVLGFVPGITTDFDTIDFAGHHSGAMLLGLFQVSILHNVVHLLFGFGGLALSRAMGTATAYLVAGGAIYLLLWVYGLVVDQSSQANFVPVNTADNWLHLVLGLGMILLGVLLTRRMNKPAEPASRP